MKYISVLTDLLVFTALGQATVQGHSNMVAAGCSVDRPLGIFGLKGMSVCQHEARNPKMLPVTVQRRRILPGLLCKAWWKYRTVARTPVADGRWSVGSKGEFWTLEGERKSFKTPSGWLGINRTGKKLKEVNIQTHQWKKKTKLADREHIYVKYICGIFFDREPTYPKFFWAKFLSSGGHKDRSIGAN